MKVELSIGIMILGSFCSFLNLEKVDIRHKIRPMTNPEYPCYMYILLFYKLFDYHVVLLDSLVKST